MKECTAIKAKANRMMGRQSLADYVNWKGDEKMIEFEYQRNKAIGLHLNHWKGGVLVNDDEGKVKHMLDNEPISQEYANYLKEKKALTKTRRKKWSKKT